MAKINSARYEAEYPVYGARFLNERTLLVTGGGQVDSSSNYNASSNNNRLTALTINLNKKKKPIKKFRELKLKDEDDAPTTLDAKNNLILLGANEGYDALTEGQNHNLKKFFFHNEHLKYVTSVSLETPQLGDPAYLRLIKLSNDASIAAIASSKLPTVILVLDPVKLIVKYEIEANNEVKDLDVSPDGKALAYITNHTLEIISMVTGRSFQRRTDLKKSTLSRVKFLNDNNLLITSALENNGGVQISNLSLDKKLKVVKEKVISKKIKAITSIDVNEKNGIIAVSGNEGSVLVLNIASFKVLRNFANIHKLSITALTFSPEGKFLASVSASKTIEVIEIPKNWGIETHKVYNFFVRSFQILILAGIVQLGWMFYSSRQANQKLEIGDYFQMKPRTLSPSDTVDITTTSQSSVILDNSSTSIFEPEPTTITSKEIIGQDEEDEAEETTEDEAEETTVEKASESTEISSVTSSFSTISKSKSTLNPSTNSLSYTSHSTSTTATSGLIETTPLSAQVNTVTATIAEDILKESFKIEEEVEGDPFEDSLPLENKIEPIVESSTLTTSTPSPKFNSAEEPVTTTTSLKKKKKTKTKTKKVKKTKRTKTRKAGQSPTLSSGSESEYGSTSETESHEKASIELTSATSFEANYSPSGSSFSASSRTISNIKLKSPSLTKEPIVGTTSLVNKQFAEEPLETTVEITESNKATDTKIESASLANETPEVTEVTETVKTTPLTNQVTTEVIIGENSEVELDHEIIEELTTEYEFESTAESEVENISEFEGSSESNPTAEFEYESRESQTEEIPESDSGESQTEEVSESEVEIDQKVVPKTESRETSGTISEASIAAITGTKTPEISIEEIPIVVKTPEDSIIHPTNIEDIIPEETQAEDSSAILDLDEVDSGHEADTEEDSPEVEALVEASIETPVETKLVETDLLNAEVIDQIVHKGKEEIEINNLDAFESDVPVVEEDETTEEGESTEEEEPSDTELGTADENEVEDFISESELEETGAVESGSQNSDFEDEEISEELESETEVSEDGEEALQDTSETDSLTEIEEDEYFDPESITHDEL